MLFSRKPLNMKFSEQPCKKHARPYNMSDVPTRRVTAGLPDDEEIGQRKKQDKTDSAINTLRRKTGHHAVTPGFGKNEDIEIN